MSIKLTELHGANERECLLMTDELESFGGAELDSDVQERILSSVMRKAGIDMKENITANKTKKKSKRFVGFMIAAAVAVTGAIGAGAYFEGYRLEDGHFIKLEDSEIIGKFGGDGAAEWLESNGLNDKQSGENGHFNVSMSSFISDGNFCQAYWCIEALDQEAMEQLNSIASPLVRAYYADTGEEISMAGSHAPFDISLNDATHYYFSQIMPLKDVDISRDIEFRIVTGAVYVNDAENLADGLSFTVNASPNVGTKIIANEDGKEFLLSPLGVSQKYRDGEDYYKQREEFNWIKSDGSFENVYAWGLLICGENSDYTGEFTTMWKLDFDEIIDISDIDGIEINGDIYLDVNKDQETTPEE